MGQRLFALVSWVLCACGSVAETSIDAPPGPCTAETDTELCDAAASCEQSTFTDRCGDSRSVDCGACSGGQGCVVGTCRTPVCNSFDYTVAPMTAFARPDVEDTIGAVTPDGGTIIYIPTPSTSVCQNFNVVVADETAPGSGTFTQQNITTLLTGAGVGLGQTFYAITSDGLTLIARATTAGNRFVTLTRSARGAVDFGAPATSQLAAINDQIAAIGADMQFLSPVISADGLQFLYSICNPNFACTLYSSVRASASVPFPAGTPMPAPLDTYGTASALSSDRLAIFLFEGYQGRVFSRSSTSSDTWVSPNAPDAVLLPAWHHKPLADCSRIIAMSSPGGCQNEDVVLLTRQ